MHWPLLCRVACTIFFSSSTLSLSDYFVHHEYKIAMRRLQSFLFVVAVGISLQTGNTNIHPGSYCYVELQSHLRLNIHANFIALCTPHCSPMFCDKTHTHTEHRCICHDKFVHHHFPKEHFRRLIAACRFP